MSKDRPLPRTDQPCAGVEWDCTDRWGRKLRDGTNVYQALWFSHDDGRACIEIQVEHMPDRWTVGKLADAIVADVLEPRAAEVIAWGDYHWQLGKWKNREVPRDGWCCEDLNYLRAGMVCEMCESARVPYVHLMSHPGTPQMLRVCGDCAEWMERASVKLAAEEAADA